MRKYGRRRIFSAVFIVLLDVLCILIANSIAVWIRFDFHYASIPAEIKEMFFGYVLLQMLITVVIFILLNMYNYVWRTVGLKEAIHMICGVIVAFAATCIVTALVKYNMPVSVDFISFILLLIMMVGLRCMPRVITEMLNYAHYLSQTGAERIMLIGGGAAGRAIIQELTVSRQIDGRVCCIIDDNPDKLGKIIDGVTIVGDRESIPQNVEKYKITKILIAIPSMKSDSRKEILDICSKTGVVTKILPATFQLISSHPHMSDMQDVKIEDLLGRDCVALNLKPLRGMLGDRRILVTGGGGSIGSELCRQIASYNPRELVIVDIYENNAYEIQQELIRRYGSRLNLHVEIASVRDAEKTDCIFAKYRPELVFHAAAHKHVPLMEDCPGEAVKNNIFGTYNVVNAAEKYGVEKFVMISTDKAVNPTNVMGATKRYCEMIVQSRSGSATQFCAVRFGNVLGSNGSVVPLFKKQIAAGGPVTVTDKRITRFFMTIPEAVQLVLEAGAMAKQSQIFVLDMGKPVRIYDMAEKMILLSGYKPNEDIDIIEIGLRPGEKLYEELLMKSNDLTSTGNEKIFVEQQPVISRGLIENQLDKLRGAIASKLPDADIVCLLKSFIPTYKSPEEINSALDSKPERTDEEKIPALV